MAFSYDEKTGNGVQRAFTFSFEGQDEAYIREEDLVVTVNGVEALFTLTSTNSLELPTAPEQGTVILIRRVMPKNLPYADFKRGNNFGQEVLNNSFLQLLYVIHELLDGFLPEGYEIQQDLPINGDLFVNGKASATESDPNSSNSLVNYREGDKRYKDPLMQAIGDFQSAITNVQAQISGGAPLEASAFSPVSWHDQVIENSVTIPDDKNAWSFGPVMSISQGSAVTVGEGSYWTIAEDSDINSNPFQSIDQGEL